MHYKITKVAEKLRSRLPAERLWLSGDSPLTIRAWCGNTPDFPAPLGNETYLSPAFRRGFFYVISVRKPPLCKGRWQPTGLTEGLLQ